MLRLIVFGGESRKLRPRKHRRNSTFLRCANQLRASFSSNSFSELAAFSPALPSNVPANAEESSRFVSIGCCPDVFVWHKIKRRTR